MRSGIEVLEDHPSMGDPVVRHNWYQIRIRMWLRRGDPVRWLHPWGTSPAILEDDGSTLVTNVRIDREHLIPGLFYGCEGMSIGAKRKLKISPHLAYKEEGVEGVIPPNAVLTAELEFIGEVPGYNA